jgi:hypothetical protein
VSPEYGFGGFASDFKEFVPIICDYKLSAKFFSNPAGKFGLHVESSSSLSAIIFHRRRAHNTFVWVPV